VSDIHETRRVAVVTRLRLLAACGLSIALFTAVVAQDKKDAPPADKKVEAPKADPKAAAPAGENELAWKFTKDTPFYQEMTTTTIQNIKVQGLDVGQNQSQTFFFKFEPKKQEGDKWIVTQTIEGVKMTIDIAGNPVSYDSTNEAAATGTQTALSEFFKALKGSQFTLTIGKDMQVEKIEGREEFIKKLIQTNKQLDQLLNKILGEEAMKQMADPTFGVVPKEAKKVGESWERKVKLTLGPLGTYDNTYKYTYKSKTGDVADIDVTATLTYTPPGADQAGDTLPFKIKEGSINQAKDDKSNKGTIKFNTKTGRIESADISVKMTGSLKLDIGGSTTDVNLTQDQKTTLKTQDKSFIVEGKKN
jgi:hypothetical protein